MKKHFLFLLLALLCLACGSEQKNKIGLSNPDIQNIIDYQDRKDVKALIEYFVHADPQIQEKACMAFGSIQDSSALESLYTMLEEKENVAQAAAFAIGQTGKEISIPVLKKILERSMNEETRFEIFVAIGKCGKVNENYYLASNYNVNKDARGTAWALFYLSRNKQLNEAGIDLALTILENEKDKNVRLGASHALSRSELSLPWLKILPLLDEEKDENVQMALAACLKSIPKDSLNAALVDKIEPYSFNTKINFLKSCSAVQNEQIISWCEKNITNNENINLQIASAEYLSQHSSNNSAFLLENNIDSLNWRVRNTLLSKLVKPENDEWFNYANAAYETTSNLYDKGELLILLSKQSENKEWLEGEIIEHDSVVATYGISAYAELFHQADESTKLADLPFLTDCLSSSNDAVIYYAADLMRDSIFIDEISVESLKSIQSNLEMPKRLEAYNEIERSICFFEGRTMDDILNDFNHPIIKDSLDYLNSIKGFLVKTTKGEIQMKVEAFEAPGTVLSIANLVKEGYYNGKLFHRVVPNFVIQTGCPYGDGWGGLDFTMRSEFTRIQYTTGAVGMASSGQDTESCQWFITHSPTPHLNGRYTIFAYVVDGMDVVQNIEVGDRILSMHLLFN